MIRMVGAWIVVRMMEKKVHSWSHESTPDQSFTNPSALVVDKQSTMRSSIPRDRYSLDAIHKLKSEIKKIETSYEAWGKGR